MQGVLVAHVTRTVWMGLVYGLLLQPCYQLWTAARPVTDHMSVDELGQWVHTTNTQQYTEVLTVVLTRIERRCLEPLEQQLLAEIRLELLVLHTLLDGVAASQRFQRRCWLLGGVRAGNMCGRYQDLRRSLAICQNKLALLTLFYTTTEPGREENTL